MTDRFRSCRNMEVSVLPAWVVNLDCESSTARIWVDADPHGSKAIVSDDPNLRQMSWCSMRYLRLGLLLLLHIFARVPRSEARNARLQK